MLPVFLSIRSLSEPPSVVPTTPLKKMPELKMAECRIFR